MPVPPSFPGVYIEEPPGPRHPIAGVSTSIAAFVGTSPRGPDNTPIRVLGQADYDRIFGGLETSSAMGFAVRDFFLNGGTEAFIIRVVPRGAEAATITIAAAPMPAPMPATTLILTAGSNVTGKPRRSRGPLDGTLTATVTIIADNRGASPARASVYDLTILYTPSNSTNAIIEETYDSISTDPESPRNLMAMLSTSGLVIADVLPEMGFLPAAGTHPAIDPGDGGQVGDAEIVGDTGEKTGIHALLQLQDDVFNLLCIPTPVGSLTDLSPATLAATARFCLDQRALFIADPPSTWTSVRAVQDAAINIANFPISGDPAANTALYFPRLLQPDPTDGNIVRSFAPCGAVAGVYARTDAKRGIWTAPAGAEAALTNVPDLAVPMTDAENGELERLGVNGLRDFPAAGRFIWGGADPPGGRPAGLAMEIHPSAQDGPLSRAEHRTRPELGGLRAERRAALGVDPSRRRRIHAGPFPARSLRGRVGRGCLLREVRPVNDNAE